jgi:7,8-dihydropterin-6-yl-methyl-4-(beta-D-ribofuranosyl)aminobenzene 5'-phosphate synthase
MTQILLILTLITTGGVGQTAPDRGPAPQDHDGDLRITIIYDNYALDEGMRTDWGFSALIEYGGERVLFDVGTQGEIFLANTAHLELDLSHIEYLVLSHQHGDHTGGLPAFIGQLAGNERPRCYVLPSFPVALKETAAVGCEVIESSPWQEIVNGIWTTGEIRGPVNEQALVVTTPRGLVVITGCAHPGIVRIVEAAKEHFGREVLHVIGGFHLGGRSTATLEHIVQEIRQLGVQRVTPTHCTGDEAISLFRQEYGEEYLPGGTGAVFVIGER